MTLAVRSTQPEQMDTDCADYADYSRCLRDLSRVNVVTFTHRPMLAWISRCWTSPAATATRFGRFGNTTRTPH
jgi:hypothetical protein